MDIPSINSVDIIYVPILYIICSDNLVSCDKQYYYPLHPRKGGGFLQLSIRYDSITYTSLTTEVSLQLE